MEKAYMTKEDYEKMRKELQYLKTVKRSDISRAVGEAREQGDLRENAGYDAARESQAYNEKKISEMETHMANVTIFDPASLPKDRVTVGSSVLVRDIDSGEEMALTLVSPATADFANGKISVSSPVGMGLLEKRPEDTVEIPIPSGTIKYRILKIL